jgi:hypothetical protein
LPKGHGSDAGHANGKDVALGAFSASRKRWSPPKQVLEPEKSVALRGQLVQELAELPSAQDATAWAQRALGAKNILRSADAAVVEAAFTLRLAELASSGPVEVSLPLSSAGSPGDAIPAKTGETLGRTALLAALHRPVLNSALQQERVSERNSQCGA